MSAILNRMAKWRNVALIMATQGDRMSFERYVRDNAEKALLYRVELSALAALLIQKGVFTHVEFTAQVEVEAEALSAVLEKNFPGFSSTDHGMSMKNPEALQTMASWRKPWGTGQG